MMSEISESINMDRFIGFAIRKMADYGYSINFRYQRTVNCHSGYVSGKTVVVATRNTADLWFQVFVHEYCHFLQELDELMGRTIKHEPLVLGEFDEFDRWVRKETELSKKRVVDLCCKIQLLEVDCEQRVLEQVRVFDLPIDIKRYTQAANAYVMSYCYTVKHRTWPTSSQEDVVIDTMPDDKLYRTWKMSSKFEDLIKKYDR
jgi:hypothetical protein